MEAKQKDTKVNHRRGRRAVRSPMNGELKAYVEHISAKK
jgi:hypothetical protein